ncbi:hypothetical protein FACS1894159_01690 [Bacteroidia bacterium]|nr:hypothetical protein FACS1894159_01690 [Bacteroidia bacterium]
MNVLLIVSDDLNDWVGCLGGNPQIKTPNIDGFAASGAMVMSNAQCAASVSNPSRTAMLTGLRPGTTGIYGNEQNMTDSPRAVSVQTMPQYFSANGYYSLSRGKIFHKHISESMNEQGQWAFDEWTEGSGSFSTGTSQMLNGLPKRSGGSTFDWGACKPSKENTPDYTAAVWAAEKLAGGFDKPFFMALGFTRPHLPLHVPQEFFDLYPLEKVVVPRWRDDDLDDIVDRDGKKMFKPSGDFLLFKEYGVFKDATRAYMACVSYVDQCMGVVMDALNRSKYRDNTIVIFIGDNGFHMGEKLRYRKATLWEEAARVPMIIKVPGVTKPIVCARPVNLIDIYPTLVELCGLPAASHVEGRSMASLLRSPQMKWDHPSLTTMGYKNHSLRDERYRYNVYANGAEELYDHNVDPMEWNNLISDPKYKTVADKMRSLIPVENAEPVKPYKKGGGND